MANDPTFAAIETVKRAEAEYSRLEDGQPATGGANAKPDAHSDHWSRLVDPALNALLDTIPTSPAGMAAKAEYLAQHLEANGTGTPPVITSVAEVRRIFGPVSDQAIIATLVRDATVLSGAFFRPAALVSRFHAKMARLLGQWSRWHAAQSIELVDAAARNRRRDP